MTKRKTKEEQLAEVNERKRQLDERKRQLDERAKKLKAEINKAERKKRTKRLIEVGAKFESYLGYSVSPEVFQDALNYDAGRFREIYRQLENDRAKAGGTFAEVRGQYAESSGDGVA